MTFVQLAVATIGTLLAALGAPPMPLIRSSNRTPFAIKQKPLRQVGRRL
jgi:hypothetical protein